MLLTGYVGMIVLIWVSVLWWCVMDLKVFVYFDGDII